MRCFSAPYFGRRNELNDTRMMSMPFTPGNNDDVKMCMLIEKAHVFLRAFCRRNDANQRELYTCIRVPTVGDSPLSSRAPHTDGCLVVDSVDDVCTVGHIFAANPFLCHEGVRVELVDQIVTVSVDGGVKSRLVHSYASVTNRVTHDCW